MADPRNSNTAGGGVLIALGATVGAFAGALNNQATIGFLVGFGLGAAGALLIWWRGRG